MKDEGPSSDTTQRMLNISFYMILLVFFVYLNTIGEYEEVKIKKAFGSLIGTFGILEGGVNIRKGERLHPKGAPLTEDEDDSARLSDFLKRFTQKNQIEGLVYIKRKDHDLIVDLSDPFLFKPGGTELRQEAIDFLEIISIFLRKYPLSCRIEGHTDNSPAGSSKYPTNWELSAERAVSVLRVLVDRFHVPPAKLVAMGFGEYHPIAPNDTPENRRKNRRVRIVITL